MQVLTWTITLLLPWTGADEAIEGGGKVSSFERIIGV